jgi:hypothetical protein
MPSNAVRCRRKTTAPGLQGNSVLFVKFRWRPLPKGYEGRWGGAHGPARAHLCRDAGLATRRTGRAGGRGFADDGTGTCPRLADLAPFVTTPSRKALGARRGEMRPLSHTLDSCGLKPAHRRSLVSRRRRRRETSRRARSRGTRSEEGGRPRERSPRLRTRPGGWGRPALTEEYPGIALSSQGLPLQFLIASRPPRRSTGPIAFARVADIVEIRYLAHE